MSSPFADGSPTMAHDVGAPTMRGLLGETFAPFIVVGVFLAVMWGSEFVDLLPGVSLDRWGIRPRDLDGLIGIPLAPFLHRGFGHLIANTIPFAILGAAIASGGVGQFVKVTAIIAAVSGAGVWVFAASNTIHLGASGLVFGYLGYLVARGIVARRPTWMLGGLAALAVYGGILWGLLPRPGISWTGHAFGLVGGVVAAVALHRRPV